MIGQRLRACTAGVASEALSRLRNAFRALAAVPPQDVARHVGPDGPDNGEERFRQVAENIQEVFWLSTVDKNQILYVSPAFETIWGRPCGELYAHPRLWLDAIHEADRARILDAAARRQAINEYNEEYRIVRPDGAVRWISDRAFPIRDRSGAVYRIAGVANDITARKVVEEENERLVQRLATTLESITDAFFTLDADWRFTYVNKEAERLLRRSRDHLLGKFIWDEFTESVSTFRREYERAMAENRRVEFETRYEPLDCWFQVRAYPSNDGGLTVYFSDITARHELEAKLRQSQRLEAVGQLTGGVAHDFNNLLTVILGNAELLAEALAHEPRLQSLATLACRAARNGADLTSRLLAFSRRQALAPKTVAIDKLLLGMNGLLRRTLGETIEIDIVTPTGLWPSFVDAPQLESAVLNLCINARDAMVDGGRLTIDMINVTLDRTSPDWHEDLKPGPYVMLAVTDTGEGMTPEVAARAFEPFFTTKDVGKGSGLGLSMVYGFIKQSGGHVKIDSASGRGTTVKLFLPKAPATGEQPVVDLAPTDSPRGSERILLVEDDDLVRSHVRGVLTGLGYRVLAFGNGRDALDAMLQGAEFDLLFTDMVMPGGLNGRQLADAARARRPGLRVLFTTGYSGAIIEHGLDGMAVLHKPYPRQALAMKLREALGEPAALDTSAA